MPFFWGKKGGFSQRHPRFLPKVEGVFQGARSSTKLSMCKQGTANVWTESQENHGRPSMKEREGDLWHCLTSLPQRNSDPYMAFLTLEIWPRYCWHILSKCLTTSGWVPYTPECNHGTRNHLFKKTTSSSIPLHSWVPMKMFRVVFWFRKSTSPTVWQILIAAFTLGKVSS